ncbi:MAG: hypothetical protein GC178_05665 [Flavobacteriales bacterium]|nr:hypothetical protein [Flavobacteriales bacterium]
MKSIVHFLPLFLFASLQCVGQIQVGNYTIFADSENYGTPYQLCENRINLVFLAEGYTGNATNDTSYFLAHVDAIVQRMFDDDPSIQQPNTIPLNRYRDYFNIYWVWVESVDTNGLTGAGCRFYPNCTHTLPGYTCQPPVNNYFGSVYDYDTVTHRLLFPIDPEWVLDEVQLEMFGGDTTSPLEIILCVNTLTSQPASEATPPWSEWGGGGDWDVSNGVGILTTARFSYSYDTWGPALKYSADLCLHEFGHMLGEVLDEYWFDMTEIGGVNEAANRTVDDSDPSLRWGEWQDGDYPVPTPMIDVNNFANAVVSGPDTVFRPTQNETCKMENVTSPYCAVCKEGIIEMIHASIKPYDRNDISPDTNLTHQASSSLVFDPAIIDTDPSYMQVTWYVNGQPAETILGSGADGGTTDFTWQFDCSDTNLVVGENIISVEIFDITGYDDSNNPLGPVFTADTRLVREAYHSLNHRDTISWTVTYNGLAQTDLWMKDYDEDIGDEPWSPFGWFFDHCPDVKVQNTQETGSYTWDDLVNESPHYDPDSSSFIYAQVRNRGCSTSDGSDTLRVYTTFRGSGDSWEAGYWGNPVPSQFGYQVGYGIIPSIAKGDSGIVEIEWDWAMDTIHPDTVNNWYSCLLARIENVTVDPIHTPDTLNITNWIHYNNNVAMFNAHVLDLNFAGIVVQTIGGKPYVGGWVYVDNNSSSTDDFDLAFDTDSEGKETDIRDEAEIIVSFGTPSSGFDVVSALDNATLSGLAQLDSVTFKVSSDNATISGLEIPDDGYVPTFVGFAFLTQQVTGTMDRLYHMSQYLSSEPGKNLAGQHYETKRVSRNLFSANAGSDETILSGDTVTLSATDIGEDALYFWLNEAGEVVGTGDQLDVSPSSTTTYTLEAIAEADGYKDYDDVTVTVTNGLITSIAPNPASSTTTVYYETTGVTTVKLKVVDVGTMMQVDNFTVTAGTGSKVITVSGYNSDAHIITLEGDGENLDAKTLMVQ